MSRNGLRQATLLAAGMLLAGCRAGSPAPVAAPVRPSTQDPACRACRGPEEFGEGWKRAGPPHIFQGADLFNHIDGAAEVFLELGFQQVAVERYRRGDAELGLELYEMEAPASARALYYRLRGPGQPGPGIVGRQVANRYQIIMQKGRYFVQVNNFTGDESRRADMAVLANRVWAELPDDKEVDILSLLPDGGRVPDSEAIVRGGYTLQSIYPLGEGDVLGLAGRTYGVAADYGASDGSTFTRLIVQYADASAAQAAYRRLVAHLDPYLEVLRYDDSILVFRDREGKCGTAAVAERLLEVRVRLAAAPAESLEGARP